MSSTETVKKIIDDSEITRWDPDSVKRLKKLLEPGLTRYFRSEVRGLESFPPAGPALVVSNHSGGELPPDGLILANALYGKFGYDRPLYTPAHYGVFLLPNRGYLNRLGIIHASREIAVKALQSGAVVMAFPGGDYDAFRPTRKRNVIDFNNNTGYVRVALEAGVPIVPAVMIGGQETQLFLVRGAWLAKRLGLAKPPVQFHVMPLTIGFPLGLTSTTPANFPLPAKIVYRVLEPIDIVAQFGENPDVHEVDAYVRSVMQTALDELARERGFPVMPLVTAGYFGALLMAGALLARRRRSA